MSDPIDFTNPGVCPVCGAALSEAAGGLCPRCLMAEAGQATNVPGSAPPSLAEVAEAFPQFEIVEIIGKGGMGTVWKAWQPTLRRHVAVKLLPASLAERDSAFAERFAREGQLLARLHHPNIVAVHDSGRAGAFFFLVMEFVDGVNLREAMRASRFTPAQALAIVPKVCDALQYAHEEGVLHRDIKPENLLLDAKGRVKLVDFGIAKLMTQPEPAPGGAGAPVAAGDSLTLGDGTLGTPHYMAPEQVEQPAAVDHRADIYSLGVVFYELLTGELPLGKFAPPSKKSSADPRLDGIVQQALEKERARRQQSAGEMRAQVETVASGILAEPEHDRAARLSRTSLAGAVWAMFSFLGACVMLSRRVEGGLYTGPSGWQIAMMAMSLPLGVTAPFGTTLLGWIAVCRIRRSAGKVFGLGLAVAEGLFFPLALLDVVFVRVCVALGLLFVELHANIPAAADSHFHPALLERIANFLAEQPALIKLVAVGVMMVTDLLIVRMVWRAVSTRPARAQTAPRKTAKHLLAYGALGCFLLLLLAILALNKRDSRSDPPPRFVVPRMEYIGGSPHSVLTVHNDAETHYVFYHEGGFSSSANNSYDTPARVWLDKGTLILNDGRSFAYHRESMQPDLLHIDGREYDLREGRVFVLRDNGEVERLRLFPSLAVAGAPEVLARLIASTSLLLNSPARQPRLQLEKAEVALKGLRDRKAAGERVEALDREVERFKAAWHKFELALDRRETTGLSPEEFGHAENEVGTAEVRLRAVQAAAEKAGEGASFGPAIERLVPASNEGAYRWFDVERARANGTAFIGRRDEAHDRADFAAITLPARLGLTTGDESGFGSVPLETAQWDTMTPGALSEQLKTATVNPLSGEAPLPRTYGFSTRGGAMGLLQITGCAANARGVEIRYKLARSPRWLGAGPGLEIVGPAAGVTQAQMSAWVVQRLATEHPGDTYRSQGWGEPQLVAPHDWVTISYKFIVSFADRPNVYFLGHRHYTFTRAGDFVRSDYVDGPEVEVPAPGA